MAEILVLIDEPNLANQVVRALWRLGHSGWRAEDGFAAARLLQDGFHASAYLVCEPTETEGWVYFVQEKRRLDPKAPMLLLHPLTLEEPGVIERLMKTVGLVSRRDNRPRPGRSRRQTPPPS